MQLLATNCHHWSYPSSEWNCLSWTPPDSCSEFASYYAHTIGSAVTVLIAVTVFAFIFILISDDFLTRSSRWCVWTFICRLEFIPSAQFFFWMFFSQIVLCCMCSFAFWDSIYVSVSLTLRFVALLCQSLWFLTGSYCVDSVVVLSPH